MTCLLLLLPVLFISGSFATYKPIYKTINTPMTGTRNVSYQFEKTQGLTAQDKQLLLDMYNYYRAFIGSGQENRGYLSSGQPPAAAMQALAWDDVLADFSQNWADTGALTHSNMAYNDPRFKDSYASENMSGDMVLVEVDMYGEVRWWNYKTFSCKPGEQCGHYLTFVNGYWAYMGCGWKFPSLVCNFAGLVTSAKEDGKQRTYLQHEYIKGIPCSKCEQGFDFCMSAALCATKAMCDSDPKNNCRCLNDASTCTNNGGTFDQASCRCKCPSNRYGVNCMNLCENTPGQDACGMECTPNYLVEAYFCNKVCNGCGKDVSNAYKYWYVDRPPKNRDNIKTRAFWSDPVVTPPTPGNCRNRVANSVCSTIATRNYCVNDEYKGICQKTCNACNFKAKTGGAPSDGGKNDDNSYEDLNLDLDKFDLSGFTPVEE